MLSGPGNLSAKALGYGLDGSGSILDGAGVEIFVHSFVSKMILGSLNLL